VIYTSGSTGRPEGRSRSSTAAWLEPAWRGWPASCGIGRDDVVLQKTAFGSTSAVWETAVGRWAFGRPAPRDAGRAPSATPAKLRSAVEGSACTVVHFVPSRLLDALPALRARPPFRRAAPGGVQRRGAVDPHSQPTAARPPLSPNARLYNLYGPDRSHDRRDLLGRCPTRFPGDGADRPADRQPPGLRGGPVRAPCCPNGLPGELVLAGPGLARGYAGRPGPDRAALRCPTRTAPPGLAASNRDRGTWPDAGPAGEIDRNHTHHRPRSAAPLVAEARGLHA